mgnify:CR=1 FL=1
MAREPKRKTTEGVRQRHERRLRMLLYLLERGVVPMSELYREFDVGYAVLETDLSYLERCVPGLFRPDKHYVIALPPVISGSSIWDRLRQHTCQKLLVAELAMPFVEDGDVVFLGGGATVLFLAMEIAKAQIRNLTVLTNELHLLPVLLQRIRQVKIAGGRVNKRVPLVEYSPSCFAYQQEPINKAFLGVEGFSYEAGCVCSPVGADVQRHASLRALDLVAILADHSKVAKLPDTPFVSFKELEAKGRRYVVVTDGQYPDSKTRRRVEQELAQFPPGTVVCPGFPSPRTPA